MQKAMRWWVTHGREECLGTVQSRGVGIDAQHRIWGYGVSLDNALA